MLTELAAQRHVLHVELSWADDRLDLRRRRSRHGGQWTWSTESLRGGFYTAHPLTDKELIPTLEKHLGKLGGELDKIAREVAEPRQRRQEAAWRRRQGQRTETEPAQRAADDSE